MPILSVRPTLCFAVIKQVPWIICICDKSSPNIASSPVPVLGSSSIITLRNPKIVPDKRHSEEWGVLTLVSGDGHFLSERVVPYLPPPPPTCGDGRDNVLSPATCSPAPGWRRLEEGGGSVLSGQTQSVSALAWRSWVISLRRCPAVVSHGGPDPGTVYCALCIRMLVECLEQAEIC